jgi:glutathione S-transferase
VILHHYALSPYSEKIRLMLGSVGMSWQGVLCPEMPPRPGVEPLAGGYRRIPVAQEGADIFCDTRLISAEIAAAAGRPELDPANCDEAALGFSAGLETEVFWACVAGIPPGRTLRQLFRKLGVVGAVRFIADRAGVAKQAASKPMGHKEAVAVFGRHLEELDRHLAGSGSFLFGDTPRYTDFAAYHTLWFQRVVGELPMPAGLPAVDAWYHRMGEFGHGENVSISAEAAFEAARQAQPRPVPEGMRNCERSGQEVTVRPVDYAMEGTTGELVGGDQRRWIVAREGKPGRLHVHFPTEGFTLQ